MIKEEDMIVVLEESEGYLKQTEKVKKMCKSYTMLYCHLSPKRGTQIYNVSPET